MYSKELQKVVDLLRKARPLMSEEELQKQANTLYELALFLVRLKVKKYLNQSKKEEEPP